MGEGRRHGAQEVVAGSRRIRAAFLLRLLFAVSERSLRSPEFLLATEESVESPSRGRAGWPDTSLPWRKRQQHPARRRFPQQLLLGGTGAEGSPMLIMH